MGKCAQVSSVLDGLCRRTFKDFLKFCAALISVEQISVVVDLMSPEVQPDSDGSSSSNTGITDTDAVPVETSREVHEQLGYNWRAVVRRNFTVLTQKLDPDTGLFEMLRSQGVISDWNFDIFKVSIGFMHKLQ